MDIGLQSGHITAGLGYLSRSVARPFNYMHEPPAGHAWDNCEYDRRPMRIRDARVVPSALGLEQSGFELHWRPSATGNFFDPNDVQRRYVPEVEALALELTGGLQAVVFDSQLRQREQGRPALGFGRSGNGSRPAAVGRVHSDYTERSGLRRRHMVLPDACADRPFLILNFWRPVQHAVFDTPLAVCDARSFAKEDWVAADLIYPERTGEIYLARHAEAHAWYYYPVMTPDEVLVFKTFDSRLDLPARMTPHCAFDAPDIPPDAPLRKSMETRCLVILD